MIIDIESIARKAELVREEARRARRDHFALNATEADIKEHQFEKVPMPGSCVSAWRQIRTREEARYAYADAMLKARDQ